MAEKCCDDLCHSESECEEKSVQTRGDSVDKNVEGRCSCDHSHDKDHSTGSTSAPGSSSGPAIDFKQLAFLNFASRSSPKTVDEAKVKKFQFWETQPVPKFGNF